MANNPAAGPSRMKFLLFMGANRQVLFTCNIELSVLFSLAGWRAGEFFPNPYDQQERRHDNRGKHGSSTEYSGKNDSEKSRKKIVHE